MQEGDGGGEKRERVEEVREGERTEGGRRGRDRVREGWRRGREGQSEGREREYPSLTYLDCTMHHSIFHLPWLGSPF